MGQIILANSSPRTLGSMYFGKTTPFFEIRNYFTENIGNLNTFNDYVYDNIDLKTKSHLFWFGLEDKTTINKFTFEPIGILEFGKSKLTYSQFDISRETSESKESSLDSLGYLFDLKISHDLNYNFVWGSEFLYTSGDKNFDDALNNNKINSFISLVPYITFNNIFFNGGLGQNIQGRALNLIGLDGTGIISPKIFIIYYLGDFGILEFNFSYLFSVISCALCAQGDGVPIEE